MIFTLFSGIKNFPLNAIWTKRDVCRKSNGLTWRQTRFCQEQFPWMAFVQNAAKDTVDECQTVLKQHDWNCQSIEKAPSYNTDLKKGKKQSLVTRSQLLQYVIGLLKSRMPFFPFSFWKILKCYGGWGFLSKLTQNL